MKNSEKNTPEKLLIETYKHIDKARNQMDQLINLIGSQQTFVHHLPDDIRQLIDICLNLPPEKREILRLFLDSIKIDNE